MVSPQWSQDYYPLTLFPFPYLSQENHFPAGREAAWAPHRDFYLLRLSLVWHYWKKSKNWSCAERLWLGLGSWVCAMWGGKRLWKWYTSRGIGSFLTSFVHRLARRMVPLNSRLEPSPDLDASWLESSSESCLSWFCSSLARVHLTHAQFYLLEILEFNKYFIICRAWLI